MGLFDLEGKVAIVTGGNGGIGLGMAQALAEAGATVVLAARDGEKAEQALGALGEARGESLFLPVDVADQHSCERLVAGTVERFGRLDVLVNNAGRSVRKHPQDLTPEEWRDVIETNLSGAFYCARAAYEPLRDGGGGKVINIGSMLSLFGTWFGAAYGASKGGLVQLTKSLAVAWAPDHIQVNAVLPGWIDTDLTKRARAVVEGLHERVLERTPSGRWGTPADLGGIAVFLAGPASDFVTGTAIPVDGGYAAVG
ncbi:MAG: glucose 1-dehydrogenase [Candidatus Dormiibacterota bacterium]